MQFISELLIKKIVINGINVYTLNMNDNPNKEFIDSEPINNREFVNKMDTEHQAQISNKNNKRKERNFDYEENSFRIPPPNPSSILNSTYLQTKEINTNEVLITQKNWKRWTK